MTGELVFNTALAFILLCGAEDDPVPAEANTPAIRHILTRMALDEELIDPSETKSLFVLAGYYSFTYDVNMLRFRKHAMAANPMLKELERFPSFEVVDQWLTMSLSYQKWLSRNQELFLPGHYKWKEFEAARQAAIERYNIYLHLWLAQKPNLNPVPSRRTDLANFRQLIGDSAFYSGNIPAFLPLEYIAEAR